MGSEARGFVVNLYFEGERKKFYLNEPLRCGNLDQLKLTGKIYETWPRQFEVKCSCGCGYQGMAYIVEEIEQAGCEGQHVTRS